MDERVRKIKTEIFNTSPAICPERVRYFTQSMKQTEGEYNSVRRSKAFSHVMRRMTKKIYEGECIVGNQASRRRAAGIYPEYATKWVAGESSGDPFYFDSRPSDRFECSRETKDEIMGLLGYWEKKSIYENIRRAIPEDCDTAWEIGAINDDWVCGAGIGNQIADFDTVLNKGLLHNIKRAKEEIEKTDLTKPGQVKRYWFLHSVIHSSRAVIAYAHDYAKLCERAAAKETDDTRSKELLAMADNCRRVPEFPAQTYWQALQSVWFVLVAQHIEHNGHAISLGRFDQYMYPFLKRDMSGGTLDRERALMLTEMFFLKVNELNKIRSWRDTEAYLGYPMNCNLGIGGQLADGLDAVNEMTYICLDACEDLRVVAPSVSVKLSRKNSSAFIDRCLSVVGTHKGGMPAFYNDEAFIRILRGLGVSESDAVAWSPVGCIESCVPGKWDFAAKGPSMNAAKIFEMTLNNGKDPETGVTLCPGDGYVDAFKSAEALFEAYKKQLDFYMSRQVAIEHFSDAMHEKEDINAFCSSLIKDCIGRGKSLMEGGAVYSADGGPVIGTNTVADCFAALQHAVFKNALISKKQLRHALETNFDDQTTDPAGEEIRSLLEEKCPKFGNDNELADQWAGRIIGYIGSRYHNHFRNSRFKKGPVPASYELSVSSVTANVPSGAVVGALPNGRRAGRPLNNGISPSNGAEKTSLTAAVRSVGKMPSRWFQKGAIFNVKLGEENFAAGQPRRNVASVIKTFFDMGGVHLQFNVLDNAVLEDAREHPGEYKDLMVRIAGYSALFASLSEELQNDVLARVQF